MKIRLVPFKEFPVALNMAIDRVLFDRAVETGEACLRFYGFDQPSITIGKFQKSVPPGLRSYPAARRPTGGRAVLHDNDLVMTLVATHTRGFFSGSVLESYRKTAELIAEAGQSLGLSLELETGKPQPYQDMCFDSTSRYELKLNGKKVVGIAQFRDKGVFLEQGSIQVPVDNARLMKEIIRVFEGHRLRLEERALSPEEMQSAKDAQREFEIS